MKNTTYTLPSIKSIALHIAIGVLLLVSVDFSTHEKPKQAKQAPVIEAVTIDQAALESQIKKVKAQKDAARRKEEQRVKDLEERAKRAQQQRQQQEKSISDLEKVKQKKQAERKRAEEAAEKAKKKQQQEKAKADKLEKQRKQKELEKQRAEKEAKAAAEKLRLEKERARKAKVERERKEREAKERAAQEKLMAEQLAKEQAERRAARRSQVMSELAKYRALITQRIQQNLIIDESMKGKQCRLNIKLAFNGLVTQVKILSGDRITCDAAQRAIYKAETLPVSKDADIYNELKDINLTFEPEF
ncbi:cell envelope integrity protein TolA [Flocculibacter collagenilyticus]|uniref:cell envelope integrity protein TolA n=1 Tax=Flocculibacter collagenilyticus TaxID=2744479 RepID=UPI001F48595A|nr:cell envelope integrity protein TolA [Flocculibacter collagenilyticus]